MTVSVPLFCTKCMKEVLKSVAKIEGVTSVVMDESKNIVTIISEADPVKIMKRIRASGIPAKFESLGPSKEEKKPQPPPPPPVQKPPPPPQPCPMPYPQSCLMPCQKPCCQNCGILYVVTDDYYGNTVCSIL